VQALLQASEADDSVVRALLAKGNPVLARMRETEHRAGEQAGLRLARLAIEDVCELLGIELTADRRALLEQANLADLQTLRLKLKSQKAWPAT